LFGQSKLEDTFALHDGEFDSESSYTRLVVFRERIIGRYNINETWAQTTYIAGTRDWHDDEFMDLHLYSVLNFLIFTQCGLSADTTIGFFKRGSLGRYNTNRTWAQITYTELTSLLTQNLKAISLWATEDLACDQEEPAVTSQF